MGVMEPNFAREEALKWVAEAQEATELADIQVRRAKFAQDQAAKFMALAGVRPHLEIVRPEPPTAS